ncbi:MAG: Co2+/Mg2+ efflux protein ApaG [Pseudomonadales bacterium]
MTQISIDVQPRYIEAESDPDQQRFVFAYTITIANEGSSPARLLNRRWLITDADGGVEEVKGAGVVGKRPRLEPGERFRYTSAAILKTPVGSMQGHYEFERDDGTLFLADIPAFSLSIPSLSMPRIVH